MWHDPTEEQNAIQRAIFALIGICVAFTMVRMMGVGLAPGRRAILILPSLLGSHFGIWSVMALGRSLKRRLVLRSIAPGLPAGPKFYIQITLTKDGKRLGSDMGILRLDSGCLEFDGLRTRFAIPQDNLGEWSSKNGIECIVKLSGVQLRFSGGEKVDPSGSQETILDAFTQFAQTPVGDRFIPPPTEPMTRIPWHRRPGVPEIGFWTVLSSLVLGQCWWLGTQGQLDQRWLLALTFSLTTLVAAIKPALRIYRLYMAPPVPILAKPPGSPEENRAEARVRA